MKQLLTILFLTLTTVGKAQDTIKIPTQVARQIVKDLAVCDSLKAVHEYTKQQLALTEQKAALQDTIIHNHVAKETNYQSQIRNLELVVNTHQLYAKDLEKKNKKLRVKLLFTKITLSGVIASLAYLYITK